jgi:hypothetical protein
MKFKLLVEKLEEYIIPRTAPEEMADFYILEFLYNKVSHMDREDSDFIKDAVNKFLPVLRKRILGDLEFAIMGEVLHLEDMTVMGNAVYDGIYTYQDKIGYETLDDFSDAIYSGNEEAIEKARDLFNDEELKWRTDYGGKVWGRICDGWLRLKNTGSNNSQLFMSIDNCYDLQHNTGTVFNKNDRYLTNEGYRWIKDFLNLKYSSKNPWHLWEYCSGSLQPIAGRLFKNLGYGSKQTQDEIIQKTKEFIDEELINRDKIELTPEEFKKYIDSGIDINYNEDSIIKFLMGRQSTPFELIKVAVEAGADIINKKYMFLYKAAWNHSVEVFKYLIDNGCRVVGEKMVDFFIKPGKLYNIELLKYILSNYEKVGFELKDIEEFCVRLSEMYNNPDSLTWIETILSSGVIKNKDLFNKVNDYYTPFYNDVQELYSKYL